MDNLDRRIFVKNCLQFRHEPLYLLALLHIKLVNNLICFIYDYSTSTKQDSATVTVEKTPQVMEKGEGSSDAR